MNHPQPNNPLHGVTLSAILEYLVDQYGWSGLGQRIHIRCFNVDPCLKSSLRFLRKTQWARTKVELLYLETINKKSQSKRTSQPDLAGQTPESQTEIAN